MTKAIKTTTVEVRKETLTSGAQWVTLGDLEEFLTTAFANGFTQEMIAEVWDRDDSEFIKTTHIKISRPHL